MSDNFFNRRNLNIDISFRCPLECPNCQRQRYYAKSTVPGYDLTLSEFEKITNFFTSINFCGQFSDPVHHPQFIKFLKICYEKNIEVIVHNSSSAKSKDWYIKAFQACPNAKWWFGIDGLPEQSHIYRINQDGEKLFDIMLESKKHLFNTPIWQYIVFKYNEDNVEIAKALAEEKGVKFALVISSRWNSKDDPLMPSRKEYRLSTK